MALPAVKRNDPGHAERGPLLRLVPGGRDRRSKRQRAGSKHEIARCRRVFRIACATLLLLTGVALVRVDLMVRATEASLTANALRRDIENERIRVESLEARCIELADPSRIATIAETSMGMGTAEVVCYIETPRVPAPESGTVTAAGSDVSVSSSRTARVLASIMRMTAGEAQVLLVGDAGLASSR